MFRVRHGRVTSLASALLRMIWVWRKGHTLCAPPRPVNAPAPGRGLDKTFYISIIMEI